MNYYEMYVCVPIVVSDHADKAYENHLKRKELRVY